VNAQEILAAWKAAADTSDFYAAFEKATGLNEGEVKLRFTHWTKLRHETAEEIAADHGMTVREGGFQAYLVSILRSGHPAIVTYADEGYDDAWMDPNPRKDRPWPASEDCPGCPGRVGEQYQHKFGCAYFGARQIKIPVSLVKP
jgi:hypothetical protein